jgi:prolyl-tRNA synthetase
MRQSSLFTKTRKEAPADEVSKNAQLLIRGGYIYKEMAGVYAYLPLGFRVLEKIKHIVREEMNNLGSNELIMTNLQRKELWETTGRWDDEAVDIWFKTKLKNDMELGLAWSHEEPITEMMKNYVSSYRDLPISVYQFQTKLRNELRAKSGIMRGREFIMKDMYTYAQSAEELQKLYDDATEAYKKVFQRIGLGDITYMTRASGGAFTKYSHEFQTITEAGEDVIYVNKKKNLAINEEVYNDEALKELGIEKEDLEKVKAVEVGNIFNFGTEKSEKMGLYFTDEYGEQKPVHLGSYGIGITRLMGVIAEHFADDRGIVWPESVAPFKIHLVSLGDTDEVKNTAEKLYKDLQENNIEVLFDDRTDVTAGEKFADADLLGMPIRIVISKRSIENGGVEIKNRTEKEGRILNLEEVFSFLKPVTLNL